MYGRETLPASPGSIPIGPDFIATVTGVAALARIRVVPYKSL
jgi:hypothetical protein